MVVRLTLFTDNEVVLRLVSDFARGLGCPTRSISEGPGQGVETELPDGDDSLLEVLSYVALTATKAGIDVTEPLCRITYWHEGASAEVTLGLRVADLSLDKAKPKSSDSEPQAFVG